MPDRLYPLLPAIYRLRDVAEGEPLRALLAVIESELRVMEDDISDLYDNWFIETCAEWVVPYIGDLLDTGELYAESSRTYGQQERRAYVANTLAYRRRKGTAPVLEQLVRDVTGWRSRAVEFFQLLATTQNLSHPRLTSTTADLRPDRLPDRVGTPFEQRVAYTAEVRRIRDDRPQFSAPSSLQSSDPTGFASSGRYNVSQIGLFVWRLQSYPIDRSTARLVAGAEPHTGRYYTFNPLGFDRAPLFNQPQTETDLLQLAQEINVPGTLRRPALIQELAERQRSLLQGQPLEGIRYFDADPVLQIFVDRQFRPIPPDEILIAALRNLEAEPGNNDWVPIAELTTAEGSPRSLPTKTVAVDPESGRLAFLDRTVPQTVEVSYLYGFSGDVGGGSYERDESAILPSHPLLSWEVSQATSAEPNPLAAAVQSWNRLMRAWQGLRDRTCVPLATITLSDATVVRLTQAEPPQFAPGIVDGLQVIASRGAVEAIVTPGVAVDRQGRRFTLSGDRSIPLKPYLDETGAVFQPEHLLVISYRSAQTGVSWQLDLLPQASIETGYPPGSFIPLARFVWSTDRQQFGLPDESVRTDFIPGMVEGSLQVVPQPHSIAVLITAGLAIDRTGQPIRLHANRCFDLRSEQGQTGQFGLWVSGGGWKFTFIPAAEIDAKLKKNHNHHFILLAYLEIPRLTISQIDDSIRQSLPKSMLQGLEVSLNGQAQISLAPGQAIDSTGRPIQLDSTCQIDLSAYSGRSLILFLSDRAGLGLPDLAVTPSRPLEEAWRQIGVIPVEPPHADVGRIAIADNSTYHGNLKLFLPPGKRLQILAANGYRPHLQGNLSVQGQISPTPLPPNALLLEGLLIEGKLIVRPGQLQRLQLNHCTLLAPAHPLAATAVSLVVRKANPIPIASADKDAALMALIVYLFVLIQRILRLGSGSDFTNPRQNLLQLTLLAMQQIQHLWALIQRSLGWDCCDPDESQSDDDEENDQDTVCCIELLPTDSGASPIPDTDNDQLKISIDRSICGTLQLTDTVPSLEIRDSIIDSVLDESSRQAIAAPGADLRVYTSTILGNTFARSLEASDCLFTHKVITLRQQVGCLRFCHVPDGSQTPQRYQCQPDKALAEALDILPQKIKALAIASVAATGTIASQDRTVIGTGTQFSSELGIGSTIAAAGQTRTVVALGDLEGDRAAQDTRLTLNQPFLPDLPPETPFTISQIFAGTAGTGVFRYSPSQGNQWQEISQTLENCNVTALLVQDSSTGIILWAGTAGGGLFRTADNGEGWTALTLQTKASVPANTKVVALLEVKTSSSLLVGTAGNGVFRSLDNGATWQDFNSGLTHNTNLTALALSPDGAVFAGTSGGVFRLDETTWNPIGLTEISVIALAIDGAGQLFAGTEGSGIFRFTPGNLPDSNTWTAVNQGLFNSTITAIAAYPRRVKGSLTSQGTIATSTAEFQPDLVNYTLTAIDQTKTIRAVNSATQLTLDSPFIPDLPPETPFKLNNLLYVTTAEGNLFRSIDSGQHWTQVAIGNSSGNSIDISALLLDRTDLWVGTTAGNILHAIEGAIEGNTSEIISWNGFNQGIPNLEEKLLILSRLFPRFTSKIYADPGYCQLSRACAIQLYTGAEDGAEMGVFNFLKQPQREANLQISLEEYLRFGLEAGIFYMT